MLSDPMKTAFDRSYLNVNLLNPRLEPAEEPLHTALFRYVSSLNLTGLPRRLFPSLLLLRLLLGMVLRIPLRLRYPRILPSSYAASATTSRGRVRDLPLVLILMPSRTSVNLLLSCSLPGPMTRLSGSPSALTAAWTSTPLRFLCPL